MHGPGQNLVGRPRVAPHRNAIQVECPAPGKPKGLELSPSQMPNQHFYRVREDTPEARRMTAAADGHRYPPASPARHWQERLPALFGFHCAPSGVRPRYLQTLMYALSWAQYL